jgi:hypothetical protein
LALEDLEGAKYKRIDTVRQLIENHRLTDSLRLKDEFAKGLS